MLIKWQINSLQFFSENLTTNLQNNDAHNEYANDVEQRKKKADGAQDGSLRRHVTTIVELVVVIDELLTVRRNACGRLSKDIKTQTSRLTLWTPGDG